MRTLVSFGIHASKLVVRPTVNTNSFLVSRMIQSKQSGILHNTYPLHILLEFDLSILRKYSDRLPPPSSQLIKDNPTLKGEYAIELLCKNLETSLPYHFLPAKHITNIRFSLCPDSHFAHGQFRNCTVQSKNSYSVRQLRNSHFAQSDSGIVQILTLRRTYIRIKKTT